MSETMIDFGSHEDYKPTAIAVNFDNIPAQLRGIPHWVLWRYEERSGKWTKPPHQTDGSYASSKDPATWNTFEVVKEAYEKGGFAGVGFVLTSDLGIVGIDLDHCIDVDENVSSMAWFIAEMVNSYTEVSPSGTGLRIFALGDIPTEGKRRENAEIYKSGRYLTITGCRYNDLPISENKDGIQTVYDYIAGPDTPTEEREKKREESQWKDIFVLSDEASKRFDKLLMDGFKDVFYKSASDIADRSGHEFHICCILAEHHFDCNEIMAIMDDELPKRGSKWHSRDLDYKKSTIEKVIHQVNSKQNAPKDIIINITEVGDLDTQVKMAVDAMIKYNSPPKVFKQEMALCRVVESSPGQYSIDRLDNGAIRHLLAASAIWERIAGKNIVSTYPPKPVVEAISGLHMWEGVPWLMGITSTPIVTLDGEIVTRPGFDEKTGFYYSPPPGFVLPPIPENPTQEDAIEAAKWLDEELFKDFPFVDEASRTNMLGALITPIARTMIDGCAPLMLIDKTTPGTGATKLVKLVSYISTGGEANLTKDPGTEEEWRKTVFSMLRDCKSLLCFDNVDADLSSSSLSQLLTSDNVSERILGQSVQGRVPNRATWMATGNNVRVAGDMTRRVCPIQLDAKMAEPWTRTEFRHPDLEQWARSHRAEILTKIYTIVKAWCGAGKPALMVSTMGSFEAWNHIIGSMLKFAGRKDFMANALWLKELSTMADEWAGFIAVFHEKFDDRYVKASEIHRWMKEEQDITDVLPKEIVEALESRGAVKAVGNRLRKKNNVRYKNGLMWDTKIDGHTKAAMYAAIKSRDHNIS